MVKKNDELAGELMKKRAGGDQARTAYKRGYKFEVEVREALRNAGWWVHRMHQSRGAMDLIAIRPESQVGVAHVAFVQCKAYQAVIRAADVERLKNESHTAGAQTVFAMLVNGRVNWCMLVHSTGALVDWRP